MKCLETALTTLHPSQSGAGRKFQNKRGPPALRLRFRLPMGGPPDRTIQLPGEYRDSLLCLRQNVFVRIFELPFVSLPFPMCSSL